MELKHVLKCFILNILKKESTKLPLVEQTQIGSDPNGLSFQGNLYCLLLSNIKRNILFMNILKQFTIIKK